MPMVVRPLICSVPFSVFRAIRIGERARLQFCSEFFNFLNRANLGEPGSTVRSTNYGVITSTSDPRIIQFALKLQF
jgi:hypothetical protein